MSDEILGKRGISYVRFNLFEGGMWYLPQLGFDIGYDQSTNLYVSLPLFYRFGAAFGYNGERWHFNFWCHSWFTSSCWRAFRRVVGAGR